MFEPERVLAHLPASVALLRAAMASVPDARASIDAFRAHMDEIGTFMPDDPIPSGAFDTIMTMGYTHLTPDMVKLEEAMKAIGTHSREGARDDAEAARKEVDTACAEIQRVARTVGVISINAGVEAARAGESGRVFSVIAKEIKLLSEQARTASGRIGTAIEGIMSQGTAR